MEPLLSFENHNNTPYILDPVLVKKPWGVDARMLYQLTHIRPQGQGLYGEVWFASTHTAQEHLTNRVINYGDGTRTLYDLIIRERHHFLGKNLSYALTHPQKRGKTEGWYIREVCGIVKIITGLKKEIARAQFNELEQKGYFNRNLTIEQLERDLVTTELARTGETFVVKPGTLHAFWPMDKNSYCVVDEVQEGPTNNLLATHSKTLLINDKVSLNVHPHGSQIQAEIRKDVAKILSADPTVRVCDFGREHENAIQSDIATGLLDYGHTTCSKTTPLLEHLGDKSTLTHLFANYYFAKDRLQVAQGGSATLSTSGKHYLIMYVVQGSVSICTETSLVDLHAGQSAAFPAYLGVYTIEAHEHSDMFFDYVPDVQEKISRLEDRGFTPEEICGLDGACFENDIKKEYERKRVVV